MGTHAAVWMMLTVAAIGANLPFLSERRLIIGARLASKSLAWRLLELALLWFLVMGIGKTLEARIGQLHPQGWAFHAAMVFFFLTLAFPGFVWCCLRRRR